MVSFLGTAIPRNSRFRSGRLMTSMLTSTRIWRRFLVVISISNTLPKRCRTLRWTIARKSNVHCPGSRSRTFNLASSTAQYPVRRSPASLTNRILPSTSSLKTTWSLKPACISLFESIGLMVCRCLRVATDRPVWQGKVADVALSLRRCKRDRVLHSTTARCSGDV